MANSAKISTTSKPTGSSPIKTPPQNKLWWFIAASLFAHSLGFMWVAIKPPNQIATSKENRPQPIEFVVVPEAKQTKVKPTKEFQESEINPASNHESSPAALSEPVVPSTTTTESSASSAQPSPPDLAKVPEATLLKPSLPKVPTSSSIDANAAIEQTKPEKKPSNKDAKPESKNQSPSAGAAPNSLEKSQSDTSSKSSSASLLGGNIQKSLSNGGEAFFSPEALAHKSVLNPSQIGALKDINLQPYYAQIKRTIDRTWRPNYYQVYTTLLTVELDKTGQIVNLAVARSSGSAEFDQEVLATFRKAAPFAPLPPEYPLDTLEFKYGFIID